MSVHLVTGGSGFVGSNIARLLSQRDEQVRVLDIWKDESEPSDVEFVVADINDRAAVNKAMRGIDYVHHNVALVPLAKAGRRFWTVNVEGTRTALESARACSVERAKRELGYRPLVELREGMRRSVAWCLENNQTI